ncbi:23S rRNA methyltransferase [Nonomuraea phyllanthi]|uniref:23S rRNA methyltransferase n=1 Tax=Nonomuraea phyllanthi TaxID=2219224 RepID=A0A5C4VXN1_9ACTN|nr:methyltransferase domain-containing protein [Nonomuraea phyllanthi]KAB8190301.1 23S rRNA methyltransferase [Nonomuraea phyllanthi]QFY05543.1 23S rRNA methyltransferase [Nonomuraea phyllanthi]
MLGDIVEYLACPVCRAGFRLDATALRCARGHAFDVARQGYVSLLVGNKPPGTADSPQMVDARARFLDAGHYAPLQDAVAETVRKYACNKNVPAKHEYSTETNDGAELKAYRGAQVEAGYGAGSHGSAYESESEDGRRVAGRVAPVIVDAGAGTGHYLAAALNAMNDGIGMAFDVSKHAVRRAARVHPRAGAFVADVWRPLPIRDGVADVVIDVFAPRNGPEFRRILRPGGVAVVVTPSGRHLSPLVEELGLLSVDQEKERRLARSLEGFVESERRSIEFEMELGHDEIAQVVGMGPSAWHADAGELAERIAGFTSRNVANRQRKVVTRASFHLSIFEPALRSRPAP